MNKCFATIALMAVATASSSGPVTGTLNVEEIEDDFGGRLRKHEWWGQDADIKHDIIMKYLREDQTTADYKYSDLDDFFKQRS